jgi:hypothetical protein
MDTNTLILAVSAFLGPVVSVGIALWRQGKFEQAQRVFQRELTTEIETQRTALTKELEAQRTKFDQLWNRAELNRYDAMNNQLYHICKAINPEYKHPQERTIGG